jgi:hypothetical protein
LLVIISPRFASASDIFSLAGVSNQHVQWNVQRLDLDEGRRLEAVCRTDADPSTLRLEITRQDSRQREQAPLGLSFSNGYLSLGAVTRQDNGLQFICSSGQASDILILNVLSSSKRFVRFVVFRLLNIVCACQPISNVNYQRIIISRERTRRLTQLHWRSFRITRRTKPSYWS